MNAKKIVNFGIVVFGVTSMVSLIAAVAISYLRDRQPVDRDQDGIADGVDDPIVYADGKLFTLATILPPGKPCFSGGNVVINGWGDCQFPAAWQTIDGTEWAVIELPSGEIHGNWYSTNAEGNTIWLDLNSQP